LFEKAGGCNIATLEALENNILDIRSRLRNAEFSSHFRPVMIRIDPDFNEGKCQVCNYQPVEVYTAGYITI
jgi:hypothetical protein